MDSRSNALRALYEQCQIEAEQQGFLFTDTGPTRSKRPRSGLVGKSSPAGPTAQLEQVRRAAAWGLTVGSRGDEIYLYILSVVSIISEYSIVTLVSGLCVLRERIGSGEEEAA